MQPRQHKDPDPAREQLLIEMEGLLAERLASDPNQPDAKAVARELRLQELGKLLNP